MMNRLDNIATPSLGESRIDREVAGGTKSVTLREYRIKAHPRILDQIGDEGELPAKRRRNLKPYPPEFSTGVN